MSFLPPEIDVPADTIAELDGVSLIQQNVTQYEPKTLRTEVAHNLSQRILKIRLAGANRPRADISVALQCLRDLGPAERRYVSEQVEQVLKKPYWIFLRGEIAGPAQLAFVAAFGGAAVALETLYGRLSRGGDVFGGSDEEFSAKEKRKAQVREVAELLVQTGEVGRRECGEIFEGKGSVETNVAGQRFYRRKAARRGSSEDAWARAEEAMSSAKKELPDTQDFPELQGIIEVVLSDRKRRGKVKTMERDGQETLEFNGQAGLFQRAVVALKADF